MKRFLSVVTLTSYILFSCKKDTTPSAHANAKFSIGITNDGAMGISSSDSAFVMGTHDSYYLINQSTNADSILWDFGNGKTSNTAYPLFPSDSAGIFQVTLIAYNKNGTKSVTSKKITVLERVLKNISINDLQLNRFTPNRAGLPVFSKVDLWFEIKYSQKADPIDKVVINCPVNDLYIYPDTGRGTIVNLYAKDNSGTYLVATSGWGGLQFFEGNTKPLFSNNFTIGFNVLLSTNAIRLNLAYQL